MNNLTKQIVVVIFVALVAIGVWFVISNNSGKELSQSASNVQQNVSSQPLDKITYQGEDSKKALDLLEEKFKVETKNVGGQPFVESINGRVGDSNHFWAFYINGQLSKVGASQYTTKNTDTIEWRYEKF